MTKHAAQVSRETATAEASAKAIRAAAFAPTNLEIHMLCDCHSTDEASVELVRHSFGHPVSKSHDPTVHPPWYLADLFAPYVRLDDEVSARYLNRLYDAPLEILADYDDPQIAQDLRYVSDYYLRPIVFGDGPVERRIDVIRALAKLFARLFAVRCSESLGHLDEATDQPFNGLCYIWWDAFNYWGDPEHLGTHELFCYYRERTATEAPKPFAQALIDAVTAARDRECS